MHYQTQQSPPRSPFYNEAPGRYASIIWTMVDGIDKSAYVAPYIKLLEMRPCLENRSAKYYRD